MCRWCWCAGAAPCGWCLVASTRASVIEPPMPRRTTRTPLMRDNAGHFAWVWLRHCRHTNFHPDVLVVALVLVVVLVVRKCWLSSACERSGCHGGLRTNSPTLAVMRTWAGRWWRTPLGRSVTIWSGGYLPQALVLWQHVVLVLVLLLVLVGQVLWCWWQRLVLVRVPTSSRPV